MTDAPHIDDRRRFKELWKELLLARVAVPLAIVIPLTGIMVIGRWANSVSLIVLPLIASAVFLLVFPTVVAKRGKDVHTAVAAGGIGAGLIALVALACLQLFKEEPISLPVLVYCMGAGMGFAEGWLERSVATTYVGLIGGTLAGAAAVRALAPVFEQPNALAVVGLSALAAVVLHLGIGLSLALGRWIRDLPKRKAGGGEPTEGKHREEHQRILPLFASTDEEFVVRFDRCSIAGNVMSYLGVCMPGVGMPGCGEPASWCYHSTACEREQIDCMYAKGEAWPFESDMMLQAIPDHAIKAMHDDFDCLIDLLVRLEAVREGSPEEADILSSLRAHADLSFETRKEWEEWGTSQAGKHNYSDWPLSVPGPTMPKPEWADGEPTE